MPDQLHQEAESRQASKPAVPRDTHQDTHFRDNPQHFLNVINDIFWKASNRPGAITTEDARRVSENIEVSDEQVAKLVSAVESYAVANETIHDVDPHVRQAPHTSLMTVVNDLRIAVDAKPEDVSVEVLRITQAIVSKMQKVLYPVNTINPEVEHELLEAVARIEPKVAEGTVTTKEANYLHSLEARARGHTEKGGIASIAQSLANKRERQLSLSKGSNATVNSIHPARKNNCSALTSNDRNAPEATKYSTNLVNAYKENDGKFFDRTAI